MIPEASVEAAWDSILERGRTGSIDYADLKAALEAAAPHMLAEAKANAWDEGIEAGVDGSVPECDYARNPYRPAP